MPLVPSVYCPRLRNTIGTISPKPEGDDREVVAAQAQRRRPEQDAEHGGDERADEEHRPEREVEAGERRGRERVGVRADREERGVAKVEQARQADDDVQAERQQDEDPGDREAVDPDALVLKPLNGGSSTISGRSAATTPCRR